MVVLVKVSVYESLTLVLYEHDRINDVEGEKNIKYNTYIKKSDLCKMFKIYIIVCKGFLYTLRLIMAR